MRLIDWEFRLNKLIRDSRERSFEWGVFDCFTFAADAVEALTGVNYFDKMNLEYSSQRGAAEHLIKLGGVEAAVTAALDGLQPGLASYGQRGDIVLMSQDGITGRLGVIYGGHALGPRATDDGHTGLKTSPIPMGGKAWLIR